MILTMKVLTPTTTCPFNPRSPGDGPMPLYRIVKLKIRKYAIVKDNVVILATAPQEKLLTRLLDFFNAFEVREDDSEEKECSPDISTEPKE